MSRSWIQSFGGKVITPSDLRPEQVTFADIGHALSQKVRFSGHLREPYSVAQHCVLGAEHIAPEFALAFLLHELSEVYLPDIPTPLKRMTEVNSIPWVDLEDQHLKVILTALDLTRLYPLINGPQVKLMDTQMLMTEKRDLMGPEPEPWGIDIQPLDYIIPEAWEPRKAEKLFNIAFKRWTK